jgi:hypothetical protein
LKGVAEEAEESRLGASVAATRVKRRASGAVTPRAWTSGEAASCDVAAGGDEALCFEAVHLDIAGHEGEGLSPGFNDAAPEWEVPEAFSVRVATTSAGDFRRHLSAQRAEESRRAFGL